MGIYTTFKVIAEMPNGNYAKFTIKEGEVLPQHERGTTYYAAMQAETDLYNRLVRKFQGEDE